MAYTVSNISIHGVGGMKDRTLPYWILQRPFSKSGRLDKSSSSALMALLSL